MSDQPSETQESTQWRSMLFVPGSSPSKLAKISSFGSLPCICDLEDSVSPSDKAHAQEIVATFISQSSPPQNLWVRINALDGPLGLSDLRAVVKPGLKGVVIPKVESDESIRLVDQLVAQAEETYGIEVGSIRIMATIESARGVANARAIASSSSRLLRLSFGSADFALDVGLDWPGDSGLNHTMAAAKAEVVLASRLGGILAPDDGSHTNFRDLEMLRGEALEAKRMGFFGKHAIHPSQVPIIEEVFQPTPSERQHAQRIVEAYRHAQASQLGVVGVDGQMVDYPVYKRAMELLGLGH